MFSLHRELIFANGEPYDRADLAVNEGGDPISLYSALRTMPDDEWFDMVADLFPDCEPFSVSVEDVIEMATGTDSIDSLRAPIRVYIDPGCRYWVHVHNGPERPESN